jgi:hypothetical protein
VAVNNFIVDSQPFTVVSSVKKLVNDYADGYEWIVYKAGSIWSGEFSITLEHTGTSVFRIEYVGSSSYAKVEYYNYLEDLLWHNIVAMYDGATLYFYTDGSLKASRTWGVTRSIYTSNLYIGRYGAGASYPHMTSQILIYSRALSDSEIRYNYQNPDNPITNGLVLWLQADPKYIQGNKWIDLSGYGNNGTIYGARLVQLEKTPARILNAKRVLGAVR